MPSARRHESQSPTPSPVAALAAWIDAFAALARRRYPQGAMAAEFARLALDCVDRDFPRAADSINRDLVLWALSAAAVGPWPEVEGEIASHLAKPRVAA